MYQFPFYIENNKQFLANFIKTKSPKIRLKLLNEATDEQLLAIVEICYNILKGRINLKKSERRKLSKDAPYYRYISQSRSAQTAKRRIQEGGSLGAVAAIIAPILGAIAQNLLDKVLNTHLQ